MADRSQPPVVVFSLNAPIPGSVAAIVDDLAPALQPFDRIRERPTLLVKRLGEIDRAERTQQRARRTLAGAPTLEARVTGIDAFEEPAAGPGPVTYLAVESPGLRDLHARLVEEFGAVSGIEGGSYVPHITLARGGHRDAVDRLCERAIEPVTWTVRELHFWDARHGERVGRLTLPT